MRRTRAFRAAYCMFLAAVSGASAANAQSTAANTWAVTIVLPSKLIAGQPATLAVLGLDGRLADGISVDVGAGQKLKTDVSGRATFTVPSGAKYLIASASGASVAALVEENAAGLNNFSLKVPPVISQRDQFPICGGGFHGDASKNHVTFDRDPAFILAASPECLVVAAGTRAIPGPVSKEQKDEIKPLIDHLQHHPHDTFKVWIELRKIDLLTAAGDYRTLLEAARTALD